MHNQDKGASKGPGKTRKREEYLAVFEGLLLFTRWLQIPLFIGLFVALLIFEIKFAEHLIYNLVDFASITREKAILVTLDLIDMVLIANLVVMVIIGGYEAFISPFHLTKEPSIPAWMRRTTSGKLKLRIATTIVLISTIHLLHEFLDPAQADEKEVAFMLIAQIIFILTAGALVFFNWIEDGAKRKAER